MGIEAAAKGAPLWVGFAKRVLDVPPGLPLDGYAARGAPGAGTLDPLAVRACGLSWHDRAVAFVALEVLGVSETFVAEVRRAVRPALPHPGVVVVAATHTHAAPAGFASEPTDPAVSAFREHVLARVTEAVREAFERAEAAHTSLARRHVAGVAAHRHEPTTRVDESACAAAFVADAPGVLLGGVGHFACHPTVLGATNAGYSGDLHGRAASLVEARLGATCLLLNGAEGDVSTRFTRRSQTPAELDRLGGRLAGGLADAVGRAAATARTQRGEVGRERLTWAQRNVRLPRRPVPAVGEATRARNVAAEALDDAEATGACPADLRRARTRLEGAELQLGRARSLRARAPRGPRHVTLLGVRVDGLTLVTVPGELLAGALTGTALERRPDLLLVGLSNGDAAYFPSRRACEEGWYEALRSPFGWPATERLLDATHDLVEELDGEGGRGAHPGSAAEEA